MEGPLPDEGTFTQGVEGEDTQAKPWSTESGATIFDMEGEGDGSRCEKCRKREIGGRVKREPSENGVPSKNGKN